MKFIVLFTILLSFTYLSAQDDEPDCARFHTGKFVVYDEEFGDSYIERTAEYQIEKCTDPATGAKIKLKDRVVWIDECSYYMISEKVKDPTGIIGDHTLTFRIIETGPNFYIVNVIGIEDFDMDVKVYVDPKQ